MKKIVLVVLVLLMAASSYADGITMRMKDATLNEITTSIAAQGNVAVILDKNVDGNLKIPFIDFQNETTEHALLKLTLVAGLAMTYTIAQNPKSKSGMLAYFLTKLSIASQQQFSSQTASTQKFQTLFQYKYSFGSQVQLKNISIGDLLLVIATSCNVAITNSEAVDQSEIIQQITISKMTPEVAFQELSKATGLMVRRTSDNTYLVAKDAADMSKMLNRFRPSDPWERFSPYFIEPLRYQ
jgi:hypothetical protein